MFFGKTSSTTKQNNCENTNEFYDINDIYDKSFDKMITNYVY